MGGNEGNTVVVTWLAVVVTCGTGSQRTCSTKYSQVI